MFKKINIIFLMIISFFTLFNSITVAIPAFPGATGAGIDTVGGRGGAVYKVTNLNDTGPGSLREAVTTSGARYVVFDVSGNINLKTILTIKQPYLTLAGETSPGGIAISGKQFNIGTHDVIVRHFRFRSGGHEYDGDNSDGDSLSLWGENWGGVSVFNVIVDHCSVTWGTDETFSVTGGSTNTTIQYCLIAEGLNYAKGSSRHSKGLMVSGKYNFDTEVSLYRNYIAHVDDRAPLLYNPEASAHSSVPTYLVEGSNNVVYNWKGGNRPGNGGDAPVNWVNNYAKEGLNSNRQDFIFEYANRLATAKPMIYISGNIGTGRGPGDAEWLVSEDWHAILLSNAWQKSTPWPMDVTLPSEVMTYTLAKTIVAESGATVPIRDSVDERIVNSFAAGTGTIPDNVSYPGDWPAYINHSPPVDSDNDGMSDFWEEMTFGDLSKAATGDEDSDGYENIEEYLHYLANGSPIIKSVIVN